MCQTFRNLVVQLYLLERSSYFSNTYSCHHLYLKLPLSSHIKKLTIQQSFYCFNVLTSCLHHEVELFVTSKLVVSWCYVSTPGSMSSDFNSIQSDRSLVSGTSEICALLRQTWEFSGTYSYLHTITCRNCSTASKFAILIHTNCVPIQLKPFSLHFESIELVY